MNLTPIAGLDTVNERAGPCGRTCGEPKARIKTNTMINWSSGPLTLGLRYRWAEETRLDEVVFGQRPPESVASLDIADYMATDVLNQQSEVVKEFLLRTSVAERLNGDLAAALTGLDNAHEFLLTELRRKYPGELVGLYRKAAEWFQNENLSREAVEYGLLAGDFATVTTLVERQSWIELRAGRMPRVIAWIRRIPKHVRNEPPRMNT